MAKIKNIKSSLTVLCTEDWKQKLMVNAKNEKCSTSEKGNILILKTNFSLCVFEKKKRSVNKKFLHLNLTGIKSFKELADVIETLEKSFLYNIGEIISVQIDNICACFKFNTLVDLRVLKEKFPHIKYNKEKFPGAFFKAGEATSIIFNSGKVNILGCKNSKSVYKAWEKTKEILYHARINTMERKTD
jgi:hypothetical protein